MPNLSIEPLHEDFGAKITGVDMSTPLDDATLASVRDAIDQHSFLQFPDQDFNDDKQLALTRQIGEPEPSPTAVDRIEYFGTIGNVQADGSAIGNDHKKTVFLTGNNMWHSDASFKEVPAFVSIMCAYETPAEGGAAVFVSARGAYQRLTDEEKENTDPLVVIHDYVYSRSKVAPDAVSPELAASLPPVRQRLVRHNKNADAKNLFIGSHAKTIEGWDETEARQLLDDMTDRATAEQHVYTHSWQPGELVIWDNRCLLHRGEGYDADRFRRYMRQTRVRGDGPTLTE